MEARINTKRAEGKRIKFKITNRQEIYRANIFPTHPYVTFTDEDGKMIEGTSYEFNTEELVGKTHELRESTIKFIEDKGRSIVE